MRECEVRRSSVGAARPEERRELIKASLGRRLQACSLNESHPQHIRRSILLLEKMTG